MPGYTTTYAVDNTAEVDVICHFDGIRRIVVQENYNSANPPTDDLLQRGSIGGSSQIRVAKGTPAIFADGPYSYGQKVGKIQAATGSITVQQIESVTI